MVRAYVTPALENVALWHERDISHSSVERMIGPDATVTLDFALVRLTGLIDKLLVYPENMQKNLDRLGGLIHSQRVLLALTQKGAAREEAYRLVQRNAMPVWRGEGDFLTFLKADKDVTQVSQRCRDRRELRPRLSPQARRHDLPTRVRRLAPAAPVRHTAARTARIAGRRSRRRRARAGALAAGAVGMLTGALARPPPPMRSAPPGCGAPALHAGTPSRATLPVAALPGSRLCQSDTALPVSSVAAVAIPGASHHGGDGTAGPRRSSRPGRSCSRSRNRSRTDRRPAPAPRRRRSARPRRSADSCGWRSRCRPRRRPGTSCRVQPADIDGLAGLDHADHAVFGSRAGTHVEVRARRPQARPQPHRR